jgi:sarcosine oxidase
MFGAAVARHLAQQSVSVALVGPEEPDDPLDFAGPFGAHHDQARITRLLSANLVTAQLARRALAGWDEVADAAPADFYSRSGVLFAADHRHKAYLADLVQQGRQLGVVCSALDRQETWNRFPQFAFDQRHFAGAIYEPPPAGHFNPRQFVSALVKIGQAHGVIRLSEAVTRIEPSSQGYRLTAGSQTLLAKSVVLCTGAYSNQPGLLERPLALRLKPEIVIYAELDRPAADVLADAPCLIYEIDHPAAADLYLLPPVRYPDGKIYLKLGANTRSDIHIKGSRAINDWYKAGDSDVEKDSLQAIVEQILPDLRANSWHTRRCVITRTFHGQPYIDQLDDRGLYGAIGGNGHSAKTAFAIAAIAAEYAHSGRWTDELDHAHFKAVWSHRDLQWPAKTLFRDQQD